MNKTKILTLVTLLFSLIVISMGAYTRLSDSGLGCPDWPGCYGYLSVPLTQTEIQDAESKFPEARPVETEKAWPEMIHRYLAATLGLLVIMTAITHLYQKKQRLIAFSLLVLIALQGTLGLWTVTLKLHPLIVMLHLLGGFSTAILLVLLLLGPRAQHSHYDKYAIAVFFIIFMQVFLGAWTSANYASLICPDFPSCQGSLFPPVSFSKAFNFLLPFDSDYEFGTLDNIARVTIHMSHRYFAMIVTFSMIGFLSVAYYMQLAPKKILYLIASLLIVQLTLGIMNILYLMPQYIAVGHNIFGLFILLSWTWLIHSLSDKS